MKHTRLDYHSLAKYADCTGCMGCIDSCGHGVLTAEIDTDGYYRIKAADPDRCTSCSACVRSCPVVQKTFRTKKETKGCYAAWSTDGATRRNGASGGIFGALAKRIIEQGGVVYGAALDGFDVRHIRCTTVDELPRLQGSKYQHSSMAGVFKQVREDLRQGKKVLFGGLSCQTAGLQQFLRFKYQDQLYLVDTICGGLSTMLPMLALKESGRYRGIYSFRDKAEGWKPTGFKLSLIHI